MKRSVEETADRFDAMSASYDEERTRQQSYTALRVVETALGLADGDDVVLDVGTGTGAVALHVAPHVARVVGLDVSEGMLERARAKAREAGLENATFAEGRFRELEAATELPAADIVTSSFAMHHLSDAEKREAAEAIGRVLGDDGAAVIGDLVVFDGAADVAHYDPAVDDPSDAATLERIFRDAGFDATVTRLGPMTGLLVAER